MSIARLSNSRDNNFEADKVSCSVFFNREFLPPPFSVAAILAIGCNSTMASSNPDASGASSFPEEPYQTVTSQQGTLSVSTWTAPNQPPIRGVIVVKLLATNAASGEPVDGLTLDIVPEMPVMGHGSSVIPQVSSRGGGSYIATDVNLFMPGRWNLDTSISGNLTDNVTIPFDVQ